MARSDAAALLASAGMPIVYGAWPVGSTPVFPCIRYIQEGTDDLYADNGRYFKVDVWSATLVSERKDDSSEAALEAAFDGAGVPYTRLGDYEVESERLWQVDYRFELPR